LRLVEEQSTGWPISAGEPHADEARIVAIIRSPAFPTRTGQVFGFALSSLSPLGDLECYFHLRMPRLRRAGSDDVCYFYSATAPAGGAFLRRSLDALKAFWFC